MLLAYTFYTAVIKIYRYQDNFPLLPKLWKEMLNYKYTIEYKAAVYTKVKTLTRKYT